MSKEAKATFIVGQQNNVDEVFQTTGRENLIYISKSSVVTAPIALTKLCRQSKTANPAWRDVAGGVGREGTIPFYKWV